MHDRPPSISAQCPWPPYAQVWTDPAAPWEQLNTFLDGLQSLTSSYASSLSIVTG